MRDTDCVEFLQWALPRLRRRWRGYRRVRNQVCKRIGRRIESLGLNGVEAYRERLEADPNEWRHLDALMHITISRFYRNQAVWDAIGANVLSYLAEAAKDAGDETLFCWSVGCASGEEPYTLSIIWKLVLQERYPAIELRILATDIDTTMLERARAARYDCRSLRDLPERWRIRAFEGNVEGYHLRETYRRPVEFRQADIRKELPSLRFHLIFCRNLVFTYFEAEEQRRLLVQVLTRLRDGGVLVVGHHERPPAVPGLVPWNATLGLYRREP